jgi:predicted Zn-dependent peptidase
MLFTQTANMNLPDVIAAIDEILAKPEAFISKDKIAEAKRSLKNKFVFLFENPVQYMKLYLQLKWDGLPENYLNDYAVNLDKVTEADVLRLAKQYYKPKISAFCSAARQASTRRNQHFGPRPHNCSNWKNDRRHDCGKKRETTLFAPELIRGQKEY